MHQTRRVAGMWGIIVPVVTGLGWASSAAEGSSITVTETFSYADGSGDETVLLPQFDTLGGTRELTGVTLSLDLSTTLRASFQNGLDVGQVVEVTTSGYYLYNQIGAWFGGAGPGTGGPYGYLNLGTDIADGSGDDWDITFDVGPNEFVELEQMRSVSATIQYSGAGLIEEITDNIIGSGMMSYRIGSGLNVDGIFTGDTFAWADGEYIGAWVGDLAFPQWFDLSGSISVTYDFVVIPLPGAVWLGGAGMLAVGMLRRRVAASAGR